MKTSATKETTLKGRKTASGIVMGKAAVIRGSLKLSPQLLLSQQRLTAIKNGSTRHKKPWVKN